MIKQTIRQELDRVLTAWKDAKGIAALPAYTLEEPPKNVGADFALNVAMLLAKSLKTTPRAVASELAEIIEREMARYVKKAEVAGPGFLNLHLSDDLLRQELAAILREKEDFGTAKAAAGTRILLEFVSANPTGPLHIGHGRGAAIGDSLGRILARLGYRVEREYYINDVGNQMEMLGRSLEARYRELKGEKVEFPQDGYKGDYLKEIARKLVESGLPAGEIDFRETALTEMMATINTDLEGFGVTFDRWFSEATLAKAKDPATGMTKVEEVCARLKEAGFAFEQENALWFASTKYGDDKDRVLRRSDGRYTYLASDIAYHKNKLGRGYDRLIDLWGADHHGYVARMKAAVAALGKDPEALTIVLYQLVSLSRNGVPVAMSTRAGEFVTLEEVVGEVGRDACRFFFMLRAPDSPLEFDLELAKKQSSENPVFYVQYVNARCSSIYREYRARFGERSSAEADLSLLTAPEERALVKRLVSFPDTLELCARSMSPHHVTTYLLETADLFHKFYEKCRVLTDDEKLTAARLALLDAVGIIIKNGLGLLGVSAPEKM